MPFSGDESGTRTQFHRPGPDYPGTGKTQQNRGLRWLPREAFQARALVAIDRMLDVGAL